MKKEEINEVIELFDSADVCDEYYKNEDKFNDGHGALVSDFINELPEEDETLFDRISRLVQDQRAKGYDDLAIEIEIYRNFNDATVEDVKDALGRGRVRN